MYFLPAIVMTLVQLPQSGQSNTNNRQSKLHSELTALGAHCSQGKDMIYVQLRVDDKKYNKVPVGFTSEVVDISLDLSSLGW